ncbi:PcfK-like family protein [Flavobacterium sp. HSC-61S13]|uniref:PcfK-like family protein n=1 Tax=Flavobacterium sp. HSC-61S13 TaxID=2910963 RepID=UPI0020A096A1|nr:PcfK-like family protein [Flavobacterium sp. HSC-61S13]MCP1996685.1 hypothetical protein [Flavobacterium sp. HSC-61S13]
MKASNSFKETIKNHLEIVAKNDKLFAVTYAKENKNIDDCITYILNKVKSSGCNGFADDEIFGMAIHYYDEDDIKVGKAINAKVVVNHSQPKKVKKQTESVKVAKVKQSNPSLNQMELF